MFIYLSLGAFAAKFGRAQGNNPDSDETYPAWIAWRIFGALVSTGVAYALRDHGVVESAIAGVGAAFLVTDFTSKALQTKR